MKNNSVLITALCLVFIVVEFRINRDFYGHLIVQLWMCNLNKLYLTKSFNRGRKNNMFVKNTLYRTLEITLIKYVYK